MTTNFVCEGDSRLCFLTIGCKPHHPRPFSNKKALYSTGFRHDCEDGNPQQRSEKAGPRISCRAVVLLHTVQICVAALSSGKFPEVCGAQGEERRGATITEVSRGGDCGGPIPGLGTLEKGERGMVRIPRKPFNDPTADTKELGEENEKEGAAAVS